MHPYFHIFSFQVPAYGFMIMLGILAAMVMGRFLRKHMVITEDDYYSAVIWLLLSGLIGSKLLYWIVELDEIIKNPHFLIETLTAGFVTELFSVPFSVFLSLQESRSIAFWLTWTCCVRRSHWVRP